MSIKKPSIIIRLGVGGIQGPGTFFALLDKTGEPQGDVLWAPNNPDGSYDPSLAWNGTNYGVAWWDYRNDLIGEVYFRQLCP